MGSFFVFLLIFLGLAILLEVPLAFSLGIGATITFITSGFSLNNLGQTAFYALDNFELLAIPFFIYAGVIMQHSGLSLKLFNFVNAFLGRIRGSTGTVAVATCALFGTLTGSLVATVAAIGKVVFPEMERKGYSRAYSGAVVANSGMLGQLIPPSSLGIVYAISAEMSVSDVWLSTVGPGILIVIAYAIYNFLVRRKVEPKNTEKIGIPDYVWNIAVNTKQAAFALLMPVIIFGGIYGGVFTPTEAGAVAAVYGMGYFAVKKKRFPGTTSGTFASIATNAVTVVGSIMTIMALASAAGRAIAFAGVSTAVQEFFMSNIHSSWLFMLCCIILFSITGMLVDGNVATLLFIPLLKPLLAVYGVDPIFFAAVTLLVLSFGSVTPPFCVSIFLAAKMTGVKFVDILRETIPFLIINYAVLIIVLFFPVCTTFLIN